MFDAFSQNIRVVTEFYMSFQVLIATATTNLVKWKKLKKSGQEMTDADSKTALKSAKKIVNILRDTHPDAYIRRSALKPEQDILFMEGEEGGMPTEAEIAVKNLLMNDSFLKLLFTEVVDFNDRKFLVGKNWDDLKAINQLNMVKLFTAVSPGFLLRQTEPEKMSKLVVNAFYIFEADAKVRIVFHSHISRQRASTTACAAI